MKAKEYQAVATTFIGFEEIAAKEVKELIGKKATAKKATVYFSATQEELAKLCYTTQSLRRVLQLIGTFSTNASLTTLKEACTTVLKKTDMTFLNGRRFRVECERHGEQQFTSNDAAATIGAVILEENNEAIVDLDDPEYIIYCTIYDTECILGIDFSGFDLTKREYKIYAQSNILNAAFAYCAVRYAGYTGKEKLVDPVCGVGLIPVEAALYETHISVRMHQKDEFQFRHFLSIDLNTLDKEPVKNKGESITLFGYDVMLRNIEAAKKHAKLAGVSKEVTFARGDVEWIDTKCDEKSVDIIVTQPPVEGRAITEKTMEKFYKEFFYQVEFILKDNGKMILLCQKTGCLKQVLEYFTIVEEHTAWQGEQAFILVTLKKAKKKKEES